MSFSLNVYTNDNIEGSYETNSYLGVGEIIKLNAKVNNKDNTTSGVK